MMEVSYKMKRTNSGPLKKNKKHHFNATMMESSQRIKHIISKNKTELNTATLLLQSNSPSLGQMSH